MAERPFKLDGSNFKHMTDAEFDRILFETRIKYAERLLAYHNSAAGAANYGAIKIGSATGFTFAGSFVDRKYAVNTGTVTRGLNDGIDDQAAANALDVNTTYTDTTYSVYNKRFGAQTIYYDTNLTNTQHDASGMLKHNDATDVVAPIEYGDSLLNTLLDECISQMHSGDEIGSYRIGTSAPAGGGWSTAISNMFVDTAYGNTNINYNLYLKTAKSTAATTPTLVRPMGRVSSADSNIKEKITNATVKDDDFIVNYMLPSLTRRLFSNSLNTIFYVFSAVDYSSSAKYRNSGAVTDTNKATQTTNVTFADPTYTKTATPSGTATTRTTQYLWMYYAAG